MFDEVFEVVFDEVFDEGSGECRGQVLEKVHVELRTAEHMTAPAAANALAAAACLEQLDGPQVATQFGIRTLSAA